MKSANAERIKNWLSVVSPKGNGLQSRGISAGKPSEDGSKLSTALQPEKLLSRSGAGGEEKRGSPTVAPIPLSGIAGGAAPASLLRGNPADFGWEDTDSGLGTPKLGASDTC